MSTPRQFKDHMTTQRRTQRGVVIPSYRMVYGDNEQVPWKLVPR